jgi:hypothetical protein
MVAELYVISLRTAKVVLDLYRAPTTVPPLAIMQTPRSTLSVHFKISFQLLAGHALVRALRTF